MKLDSKIVLQSTVGTFVLTLPLILLALVWANQDIWSGYALGKAGRIGEYCELIRMSSFIRQSANSWSNVVYVWIGLYCLLLARKDTKNPDPHNLVTCLPIFTIVTGISFLGLAVGSFMYHASLSVFGQWLDVGFMYACACALLGLGLLRTQEARMAAQGKEVPKSHIGYILTAVFMFQAFLFAFKWEMDAKTVLPFLIIGMIVIAAYLHINGILKPQVIFAVNSLALLLIAFAILIVDVKKILCSPENIVQGHSIWHLLTAASLFMMYFFFREMKSPNAIRIIPKTPIFNKMMEYYAKKQHDSYRA